MSSRAWIEVPLTHSVRCRRLSICRVPRLTVETYTSPYSPLGVIGDFTRQYHLAYGFCASFSGDWYFFKTKYVHFPSKLCQTSYACSAVTVFAHRFLLTGSSCTIVCALIAIVQLPHDVIHGTFKLRDDFIDI